MNGEKILMKAAELLLMCLWISIASQIQMADASLGIVLFFMWAMASTMVAFYRKD